MGSEGMRSWKREGHEGALHGDLQCLDLSGLSGTAACDSVGHAFEAGTARAPAEHPNMVMVPLKADIVRR